MQTEIESLRHHGHDALRGIAILLVLLIHGTAYGPQDSGAYLVSRNVMSAWMPIFLLLSGYYAAFVPTSLAAYSTFIRKKVIRILLPYIIWSLFCYVSVVRPGQTVPLDIVPGLIFGRFSYPYYFISIIFKFMLIAPILTWASKRRVLGHTLLAILAAIYTLVVIDASTLRIQDTLVLEVLFRRSVRFHWILFFYLGIWCRRPIIQRAMQRVRIPRLCFGLLVGVALLAAGFSNHLAPLLSIALFAAFSMPSSMSGRLPCLTLLGRRSYTIFLLHEPAMGTIDWFLRAVPHQASSFHEIMTQVISLVVGIAVPLGIYRLLARLYGRRTASLLAG